MCHLRQVSAEPDTVRTMTVVDDNYTGHVDPQTAARRTLPGASIVKVSVGPMDNNAYLVTCSQTGETLLIDAANDAEILLELIERFAPKLSLIVTSHQHAGPLAGTGRGGEDPPACRRPHINSTPNPCRSNPIASWPTATQSRSASSRSTSSTCRATPRDPWRWRSTGPTKRPTCSRETACSPVASERPGRRRFHATAQDVTSRVFDVYPDSTVVYPGTATTRRSAPNVRTWANGVSGVGDHSVKVKLDVRHASR